MSYYNDQALSHHGIKGMKWGRRRFQNKDGSLTPAGRKRYDDDNGGLGDTSKSAANMKQFGARWQAKAKETAEYQAERMQARKKIKNPIKRAQQSVKDQWNQPCLSLTGKDATYGKEYVKGALIGLAASVTVVGFLDRYT